VTDSPPDLGAVFDAAHDEFAVLSPLLWEPIGAATVARSAPQPGERVLDVCCGAGASALLAAAAVGPDGQVDGIDLADRLLDIGRALASRDGLTQLRFTRADATTWAGGPYDVVQCVFGVFFFADMDIGAAHLVGLLRPGGRFVATTWARSAVKPVPEILVDAMRLEGAPLPSMDDVTPPPERIETPETFAGWLTGIELHDVEVTEVPHRVPLDATTAWSIVMGAAMRAMLMGLAEDTVARVRERFVRLLDEREVTTFDATTLIGSGRVLRTS